MNKSIYRYLNQFLAAVLFISSQLEGSVSPIFSNTPIHEAFVTPFTDITPATIASKQPPAPRTEQIPPQPYNDAIWIPGYWVWVADQNDFTWVCGVWRRPPLNHNWIRGEWINDRGGWVWARGFWSPVLADKIVYINTPPPASLSENITSSPGNDNFWVPGYWDYSTTTKQYSWLSGTWYKFNQNWILAPATYIWRPSGYAFVPLHWDWPLETRGNAYTCSATGSGSPVIIDTTTIIQQCFIYYPNYVNIYWHWWHFHPGWWNGCWCLPPWWSWSGWWIFSWDDLWQLWWWWGHPGFLPPFWLSLELSMEIAPPSEEMIHFFEQVPQPNFPTHPGDRPLPPSGRPGTGNVPRPEIPNPITPGPQVTVPTPPSTITPPSGHVNPPSPPPPPSPQQPTQPYYPPSTNWNNTPQPSYPPQSQPQPTYPVYP